MASTDTLAEKIAEWEHKANHIYGPDALDYIHGLNRIISSPDPAAERLIARLMAAEDVCTHASAHCNGCIMPMRMTKSLEAWRQACEAKT